MVTSTSRGVVRSISIVLAGAALASTPGVARAQGDAAGATADDLFQEGRRLLQADNVAAACVKFKESLNAEWADGTLLALAACHQREGKLATAWTEFGRVLVQAQKAGRADAAKLARDQMAALEKQVPMVIVAVPKIRGIQVKIDGDAIAPELFGTPLPFDPGTRRVDATAPGYKPWSTQLGLTAGAAPTDLAVPALERITPAAPPPAPAIAPPPEAKPEEATNGRRTAAFVVGGVGMASLGVGVVTGIMALGKASTIQDPNNCDIQLQCNQTGVDAGSSGATLSLVSTVTVIAGLAGIGVGTYLVVTSKRKDTTQPTTAFVPLVSRDTGGVSFTRTF